MKIFYLEWIISNRQPNRKQGIRIANGLFSRSRVYALKFKPYGEKYLKTVRIPFLQRLKIPTSKSASSVFYSNNQLTSTQKRWDFMHNFLKWNAPPTATSNAQERTKVQIALVLVIVIISIREHIPSSTAGKEWMRVSEEWVNPIIYIFMNTHHVEARRRQK